MTDSKQHDEGKLDAVDAVLADYMQRIDVGETVDRNEYLSRFPEHELALLSFFRV